MHWWNVGVIAELYLDETGAFSAVGESMRIVGGLLIVANAAVGAELAQIHGTVAAHLGWPVRLHALELNRHGYRLLWHASGGLEKTNVSLPPESSAQFQEILKKYPVNVSMTNGPKWTADAKAFAKSHETKLKNHVRAASSDVVGKLLRSALEKKIEAEFRAWCGPERSAYIISACVDDSAPVGIPAYQLALNEALRLASLVAMKGGATQLSVTIANPELGATNLITSYCPQKIGSVDLSLRFVEYDDGGPGLWLADTLVSWTRPHPRATFTPLNSNCAASKCLVAGIDRPYQGKASGVFGDYLAAVSSTAARFKP